MIKADVDEEGISDLAGKYNIQAVPTLIFFKKGQKVNEVIGGMKEQDLDANIKAIL